MWFVRWLVTLLLMIYAVVFAALNLDPITLTIPYIPLIHLQPVSKAVIVLLAVALGVVVWAVVAFLGSLEFRSRIRQLERQNRDMKLELTNLRNRSILDDNELEGASVVPAGVGSGESLNLDYEDYDTDQVVGDVPPVRKTLR